MATTSKDLQAAGPTSIVVAIEPGTPFTVDELLDLVDKALVVDPRPTSGTARQPTT